MPHNRSVFDVVTETLATGVHWTAGMQRLLRAAAAAQAITPYMRCLLQCVGCGSFSVLLALSSAKSSSVLVGLWITCFFQCWDSAPY